MVRSHMADTSGFFMTTTAFDVGVTIKAQAHERAIKVRTSRRQPVCVWASSLAHMVQGRQQAYMRSHTSHVQAHVGVPGPAHSIDSTITCGRALDGVAAVALRL